MNFLGRRKLCFRKVFVVEPVRNYFPVVDWDDILNPPCLLKEHVPVAFVFTRGQEIVPRFNRNSLEIQGCRKPHQRVRCPRRVFCVVVFPRVDVVDILNFRHFQITVNLFVINIFCPNRQGNSDYTKSKKKLFHTFIIMIICKKSSCG